MYFAVSPFSIYCFLFICSSLISISLLVSDSVSPEYSWDSLTWRRLMNQSDVVQSSGCVCMLLLYCLIVQSDPVIGQRSCCDYCLLANSDLLQECRGEQLLIKAISILGERTELSAGAWTSIHSSCELTRTTCLLLWLCVRGMSWIFRPLKIVFPTNSVWTFDYYRPFFPQRPILIWPGVVQQMVPPPQSDSDHVEDVGTTYLTQARTVSSTKRTDLEV